MADWYLTYNLDIAGGYVAASFEANGTVSVRATAPFRGSDHVGFYRAVLPRERVAALREQFARSGYATAPKSAPYGPDVPTVSFGEGRGSEDADPYRTFALPKAGPDLQRASEAASELVLEALGTPLAALRASGRMTTERVPSRATLEFSATFQNNGREPARWPQPLVALAGHRARVALQVVESGTERVQQVELAPERLRLATPEGAPAPGAPLLTVEPGASFVLAGSAPAYLEPARYRAALWVEVSEPQDAGETSVYGTWVVELGSFEVQP